MTTANWQLDLPAAKHAGSVAPAVFFGASAAAMRAFAIATSAGVQAPGGDTSAAPAPDRQVLLERHLAKERGQGVALGAASADRQALLERHLAKERELGGTGATAPDALRAEAGRWQAMQQYYTGSAVNGHRGAQPR